MSINTTEKHIAVTAIYNSEFVQKARELGGKWSNPSWVFDIRDEAAVRAACLECYGMDGLVSDTMDVRVTIAEDSRDLRSDKIIELFGRPVARAWGRDTGAKLGDGIVVESGGFTSGGSVKNWLTKAKDNTVFIMRDVSRVLVERHDNDAFVVETISASSCIDKNALALEREKLMARVAEIDALLKSV